jgi:hypothetical protein
MSFSNNTTYPLLSSIDCPDFIADNSNITTSLHKIAEAKYRATTLPRGSNETDSAMAPNQVLRLSRSDDEEAITPGFQQNRFSHGSQSGPPPLPLRRRGGVLRAGPGRDTAPERLGSQSQGPRQSPGLVQDREQTVAKVMVAEEGPQTKVRDSAKPSWWNKEGETIILKPYRQTNRLKTTNLFLDR